MRPFARALLTRPNQTELPIRVRKIQVLSGIKVLISEIDKRGHCSALIPQEFWDNQVF